MSYNGNEKYILRNHLRGTRARPAKLSNDRVKNASLIEEVCMGRGWTCVLRNMLRGRPRLADDTTSLNVATGVCHCTLLLL